MQGVTLQMLEMHVCVGILQVHCLEMYDLEMRYLEMHHLVALFGVGIT